MDYFNGFNRNSYGLGNYQTQPNQIYQPQSNQGLNGGFGLKTGIQYATKTEMEALILPPNTQVMAMGKDGDVFYVKTADELGRSTVSVFDYTKHDENVSHETKDYLTKDDLKDFATKKELESILMQFKDIEKLLKVGGNNGKEKNNS